VVTTFFLLQEWIKKKTNFLVFKITLLDFLLEIKEIKAGDATYGILYNCLPKVIITLGGLDSYTTCRLQKYGWHKITSQKSREAISQNTSSLKGLML
jgi:hypothetical protein